MDYQLLVRLASSLKINFTVTLRVEVLGFEGTYDIEWMNIPPVAKLLKIKKGAAKVKDPSWLKE